VDDDKTRRFRFSGNVSLGNILAILTIIGSGFLAYTQAQANFAVQMAVVQTEITHLKSAVSDLQRLFRGRLSGLDLDGRDG
jgi:geranylgeranyl pyrophosphate synthase